MTDQVLEATERDAPPRSAGAWRCHALIGGLHLVFFCAVFQSSSWLAAQRAVRYRLYLGQELAIPFAPTWIWAYASMAAVIVVPPLFLGTARLKRLGLQVLTALLVSCVVFVAFPGELGFVRVVPDTPPYDTLFTWLFASDRDNNLAPSLHVSVCMICIAAFANATRSKAGRAALWTWLAAIMASTVMVHQHHLLDVASGFALGMLIRLLLPLSDVDS